MDARNLEAQIEAAVAGKRPTCRAVRDLLVDYYVAVASPFIRRGLSHTDPAADDATVVRLASARLHLLWDDLGSDWNEPSVEALGRFRVRIEHYACARDNPALVRVRALLDELFLSLAVGERLAAAREASRRLRLIRGEGAGGTPRGTLRLVQDG